ncbi:Crossover junction endonuclease mus81 [Porites harrisoni]
MSNRKKQRVCPNPLFLKWLEDWRDEAKEKNSKLQYTYGKAASAVRKYPLPLRCGKDAMILDNIGEMIARRLDEAMAKYNASNQQAVDSDDEQEEEEELRSDSNPLDQTMCVPPPPLVDLDNDPAVKKTPKKRKPRKKVVREYIPTYRSGPYALMLTLYQESQRPNYRGYMTRAELQKEAQPFCEASFTMPDPGSHYTAWSSMSTLIRKGFIIKTNNPARYSLTNAGCELAEKLETVTGESLSPGTSSAPPFTVDCTQSPSSCRSNDKTHELKFIASTSEMPSWNSKPVQLVCLDEDEPEDVPTKPASGYSFTSIKETREEGIKTRIQEDDPSSVTSDFILRPGTFDIILCVDVIETTGGQAKSRKEALIPELKKNGVQFDVRKLQLGDFLWVARERTTPTPGCLSVPVARELVLDYIAERKRMDDLCCSITDGRFREQKFRLRHCGLKHPIYLVEDFGSIQHMSLPESTLLQAIVNTQIVDGFFVKRTHDLKESVAYLTVMTRHLQKIYSNKTLVSRRQGGLEDARANSSTCGNNRLYLMNFRDFNDSTVKNKVMTVSEVFAKQLMQISGVSPDKAVAILEKYPTPKRLLDAYKSQGNAKDRELLLSSLKCGKNQRNLGPSLSKMIYQLYCSPVLS